MTARALDFTLAVEVWYNGVDNDCDGSSDLRSDRDGYDSDQYGVTTATTCWRACLQRPLKSGTTALTKIVTAAMTMMSMAMALMLITGGGADCEDFISTSIPVRLIFQEMGLIQSCDGQAEQR